MTSPGGPSSEFKDQTFLDADGITEIKPGTLLHVLAAHDKRKLDEPLDVAYGEYVVMYKFAGNDVMVMVAQSAEKAPYEVTISAEIRIDEIEQIDSSWVKASEQTDLSEETFEKAQLVGMPVGYDHRYVPHRPWQSFAHSYVSIKGNDLARRGTYVRVYVSFYLVPSSLSDLQTALLTG